jgi:hypothetical protein
MTEVDIKKGMFLQPRCVLVYLQLSVFSNRTLG